MTNSQTVPDGVKFAFAADICALIVCLIATIADISPWPAFWLAVLVLLASAVNWVTLKRAGNFHPLATSAVALGVSALAWSIGLVAAAA